MFSNFDSIFKDFDRTFRQLERQYPFGFTVVTSQLPDAKVSELTLKNGEEFKGTLFGRALEVKSSPGETVTVTVTTDSLQISRVYSEGDDHVTSVVTRRRLENGNQKGKDGSSEGAS